MISNSTNIKNIIFLHVIVSVTLLFFPIESFCLSWPIPEGCPDRTSITGTHGEYRDITRTHVGIDIGVVEQPVIASVGGKVKSGYGSETGYYVKIGDYRYYHLANDEYLAKDGSWVNEGDRIGTSSNTGASGKYHLHFGIGDDNPLLYFSIPDTNDGSIGKVYFRHNGNLLELTNGMIFNRDNPFPASGEFIVNAYDVSNTGRNHVNFYRIVSLLDGDVLRDWEFNVSHTVQKHLWFIQLVILRVQGVNFGIVWGIGHLTRVNIHLR